MIGEPKAEPNAIGALLGTLLLTVSLLSNPINTNVFTTWVSRTSSQSYRLSVIIMDNASFHKGTNMQHAIEAAEHTLLYLPPSNRQRFFSSSAGQADYENVLSRLYYKKTIKWSSDYYPNKSFKRSFCCLS